MNMGVLVERLESWSVDQGLDQCTFGCDAAALEHAHLNDRVPTGAAIGIERFDLPTD